MGRVSLATVRVAAVTILIAALLSIAAGAARAETPDERALRDWAMHGNLGEVQRLLAEGADPDVPDHMGRTSVHRAAENGENAVLDVLLEAGANPDARDDEGRTPLHLAAASGSEPDSQAAIEVLLRRGASADPADAEGRTPLHVVAKEHREAASVHDLLAAGADPARTDNRGDAPLHYAVGHDSRNSVDVVGALVDAGAGADAIGSSGETPLQLFARIGAGGAIVTVLTAAGADPDRKNPDGETPLHTAIRNGGSAENSSMVEALLAAGADPCIQDAQRYTPYQIAREGGAVHSALDRAHGHDLACDDRNTDRLAASWTVDAADWPGELTARSNVRSGPGTDHDILATLDGGTAVHVTGTVGNTDWLQVEVAGETAFVHASLVREVEAAADGMEGGEQERTPGIAPADRIMHARDDLVDVRSGPGADHAVLGQLIFGQKVRVTGEAGEWLRIEARRAAFVHGSQLIPPDQFRERQER